MTYPPLATLEERPLHLDDLDVNERWACSLNIDAVKEMGLDGVEPRYDWRCPGCIDFAAYLVSIGHRGAQQWRRLPEDEPKIVTLDWLVRRARYWLGQP